MGGAASTSKKEINVVGAESKKEASPDTGSNVEGPKLNPPAVDMKELALGDSVPQWGDHKREYDSKLSEIKKSKQATVGWNSESSGKSDVGDCKMCDKDTMKPECKPSTPQNTSVKKPSRPPPPSVKPRHITAQSSPISKHQVPIGHNVVYTPEKVCRDPTHSNSSKEQAKQLELSNSTKIRSQLDPRPDPHNEVVINSTQKIYETPKKKDSYIDRLNNLRCVGDDSDDSDEASEKESELYDWSASNTNMKSTHIESCLDTKSKYFESYMGGATSDNSAPDKTPVKHTPSQLIKSASEMDDDLYATFTNYDDEVEDQKRPQNVPKLNLPQQCLSSGTPPPKKGNIESSQAKRIGQPVKPAPPPRNLQRQMHHTAGPVGPKRAPSNPIFASAGPKPVPTNRPHPPLSRPNTTMMPGSTIVHSGGSSKYTQHEVKETKDVKRNRAQLPSTLTHAKPTTGDWLKKRYIVNNFILLDTLGTGSYGEVKLCKDRTTDQLFAMKIFSKEMLKKKKGGNTSETYFEDIKREIAIMKKLQHPNVLRLFEVLDDPKVNKMYLVLEYMKRGDLINFIKMRDDKDDKDKDSKEIRRKNSKTFTPLSDSELWVIFKQVTAGVRYLHFQNIVHGDIKPQNILVGEDGVVKIADFGISKMLENGSTQKLVDAAGTPAFMSPELCAAAEAFSGQLADIWAIGATMYMLRFGQPPFVASNIMALYNKIINDPLEFPPSSLDPGLRNLLVNMLEKDSKLRYNMDQVITHPWLRVPPRPVDSYGSNMHAQSAGMSKDEGKNTLHITDKYIDEEAKAMNGPVNTVDNDEVFKSIGFGVEKKDKIDEDCNSGEGEENIMASDWALDVFEKVDDEEFDSDDDSDDDSDHSDSKDDNMKSSSSIPTSDNTSNAKKTTPGSELGSDRGGMDESEQARRSRDFQSKLMSKTSNYRMPPLSKNAKLNEQYPKNLRFSNGDNMCGNSSADDDTDADEIIESRFGVTAQGSIRRDHLSRAKSDYGSDKAEELSMNDFEKMMDTLAMRPVSNSALTEGGSALSPDQIEAYSPHNVILKGSYINSRNGCGGVFHSEQGCRKCQEDRFFVALSCCGENFFIGDDVLAISHPQLTEPQRVYLQYVTIAGVFDGHSGFKCSKYLSENIVSKLLEKSSFYASKTLNDAILDACDDVDNEVCDMLRKSRDSSGSTGVIVVYDGRSRKLTIANVGDSMCVLCRSGKAVSVHRTHRVGDDADEINRVLKSGGSVVNKRVNGVLAISRAYGDTAFKDIDKSKSPVISVPDIYTEIVTPMTEFCIIATDGLWDVIQPQLAVNYVRKKIGEKVDAEVIAQELVDDAIERGSIDNVTAVILFFHLDDGTAHAPSKLSTIDSTSALDFD